jgi:hypothetical protein
VLRLETPASAPQAGDAEPAMTATIGPDDFDFTASPRPDLLRAVTGLEPVPAQTHVLLADYGVNSCQRLAAGDAGGRVTFGLWPAELKEQAKHLYGRRLGRPMISAARAHGWSAAPSPHLAFWNAAPIVRLYMSPSLDAADYARRWEDEDLEWVGGHTLLPRFARPSGHGSNGAVTRTLKTTQPSRRG